ncbi:hypothetical protein [Dyella sp. 2HG41-7]|uniref:hypothetical protein n=1 Tax=Dyella sp. 2HG41-7 TaxID=2883239 RepID=UPI001F390A18|nr:hypothetical protein [Dyella sp. 2HG41-7]
MTGKQWTKAGIPPDWKWMPAFGDDERLFIDANRYIQQLQEKVHLQASVPSGHRSHQNYVYGSTGNTGIDQF